MISKTATLAAERSRKADAKRSAAAADAARTAAALRRAEQRATPKDSAVFCPWNEYTTAPMPRAEAERWAAAGYPDCGGPHEVVTL